MGKKYIIEIPEDKIADFVGSTHFLIPYMMAGHIGHHDTGLPIKPYTEPDIEQVGKEEYDKGYHDGHNVCYENAKDIMEEKKKEAYQRGLADAWEAARKIANLVSGEQKRLFGCFGIYSVAHEFSAAEAIEKLKTYEQEQEQEEIKVGDEVENTQTGVKFIVTHQWENNRGEQGVSGLNYECSAFSTALDLVRKTGRHFPEIASVLQKMRGEQE